MKMAKASEADLKMACELASMLEGFERGHFPPDDDGEADDFCIDLGSHCQSAMDKILDKLTEGSLFRVVFGMSVLLDPKNEAVDPSCDYLEHHPKVRMHDELVEALRPFAKFSCSPQGECDCNNCRAAAVLANLPEGRGHD
jgi:hypothetical protein